MMNLSVVPNREQIKNSVQWFVATFGGGIAGFFVGKGWFTTDQVISLLNSEVFIGVVVSGISLILGMVFHTDTAVVSAAANVPNPQSPTGKTEIVTSEAISRATPDLSNVSSSSDKIVLSR